MINKWNQSIIGCNVLSWLWMAVLVSGYTLSWEEYGCARRSITTTLISCPTQPIPLRVGFKQCHHTQALTISPHLLTSSPSTYDLHLNTSRRLWWEYLSNQPVTGFQCWVLAYTMLAKTYFLQVPKQSTISWTWNHKLKPNYRLVWQPALGIPRRLPEDVHVPGGYIRVHVHPVRFPAVYKVCGCVIRNCWARVRQ